MTSPTTTTSSTLPAGAQSPVQQVPIAPADTGAVTPSDGVEATPEDLIGEPVGGALDDAWANRLGTVLWQLGFDPEVVRSQLEYARGASLSEDELQSAYAQLTRELALQHASDAWQTGVQVGQVPPGDVGQGGVQLPPSGPPQVPPPGTQVPTDPQWPQGPSDGPPTGPKPPTQGPGGPGGPGQVPDPTEPPPGEQPPGQEPPPKGGDHDGPNLAPWLIGAGILGAGVAGVLAYRTGARNVRALKATALSFESGAMHQGGLQSIRDAQLGARFAGGIGTKEYLQVALPIVNRVGTGGKLVSVARGHLDQAELMATATALQHGTADAVHVNDALRRSVLARLEGGTPLSTVLDDLDRSAAGARPVFDNPQLKKYAQVASIVERGKRAGGEVVTAGDSLVRPKLGIVDGQIAEVGGTARIDRLVAARDARLGRGTGFADGIGSIQGVNVSTLNPAMQARAIEASGIPQSLVDAIGLRGAYMQRWRERVALGAAEAANVAPPTVVPPTA